MGYVAARGGRSAIEAAERLIADERRSAMSAPVDDQQFFDRLPLLVDRVMGEAGVWEPDLAAAALRQADGDPLEAVHLLRSHRSTMPRFAYSAPVSSDEIEILRRVVPAYRQPPGPQLLGRTTDYTGRLLDVSPPLDDRPDAHRELDDVVTTDGDDDWVETSPDRRPKRLLAVLRDLDLVVDRRRQDDPEPFDVTRRAVRPGVPRSARLAVMSRAETGALVNLWYRNILGPDGYLHEITLGEVRHGRLPVPVTHPVTGNPVEIGQVRVTEVEAIEDLDGVGEDRSRFDVGYGICLGHNEKKAIAMANLDIACERDAGRSSLEQSVLMTTDGLDAAGFLEHLKLPHYVTFRSMVERKLTVRSVNAAVDDAIKDNTTATTTATAATETTPLVAAPAGAECA